MAPQADPLTPQDPRSADPLLEDLVRFVGYRPNALLTMARKPGLLGAVLGLVQVALRGEGALPPELRFLVACEASRRAGCFYSATHAVHATHHLGVPWEKLAALDRWETSPHYTAQERAALAIACAGGTLPIGAPGIAFEGARRFYSGDQILEIVAVVALFGWFNRWNSLMGTVLEGVPAEAVHHVAWLEALRAGVPGVPGVPGAEVHR